MKASALQQDYFTMFFVAFMALVIVQRLVETFRRRPVLKGQLVIWWSFWALMAVHAAVFIGSIVEYFLVPRTVNHWLSVLGVLLYVAALVLRNKAIATLGRFWSLHVEIRPEHAIVKEGVYSVVRHPAYVAIIMELFSVPLVANAWCSLLIAAIVYLPMLMWRISFEEKALVEKFGDAYRQYQQEVGQLMPKWSRLLRPAPATDRR